MTIKAFLRLEKSLIFILWFYEITLTSLLYYLATSFKNELKIEVLHKFNFLEPFAKKDFRARQDSNLQSSDP